ncbi:GntR family transcriptional regulator [Sphingomonas prati]|uniref:DNA-binding GntR family transcriptional regulator n=1 Tax=Sphingomonas prati TaxID=1843237 RepID=A0A7W9BSJ2_9SPHN|nr:GntR family transcriptional regulator [Sphingomonas prati]MBB5729330.1 DNA-binding GntR family transcriptional regulator [Sphingomonas prati]GGE78314.1 GntR family transcriptional regulator [Sphingomonas prati]
MSLVIRNLSDQVADLVRDRIISGSIPGDQAIRQDALAAELGVSKIPLREALTRLEQQGLVFSQANRGFFVRPLSTSEAEEVFALRLKLEPEATAAAALRAESKDQQFATATIETLEQVTDAHGAGVGAFNRAFHLALLRPCAQPVTLTFLERLHILSERYVRKHLEWLGRDDRANAEHRMIFDAWLARDEAAVIELSRVHVVKTLDDLRLQLG